MTTPSDSTSSPPPFQTLIPDPNSSLFADFNNTELAVIRTDMAEMRTDMAQVRTELSETRTDLARDRNHMAAERTLMAWIRTSLALISFGFGIDRFFKYIDRTSAPTAFTELSEERLLGLSLMVLGVFALGGALVIHWQTLKQIERKDYTYLPGRSLGVTVAIILLFISIAIFMPLLLGEVQLGEIFNLQSPLITNLAGLTIFILMLTMGIAFSVKDLLFLVRQPSLLGRSLLATLILFPLLVGIVIYTFDLQNRSIIALICLASAPAAPLLTKRVSMAQATISKTSLQFAASLQITLAILSVLVTPLIFSFFASPYPAVQEQIDFFQIAKQIAIVQLLPLSIGLVIRQVLFEIADEVLPFMLTVSNTLFFVVAIFLAGLSYNLIPATDINLLWASAIITIVGLGIGHVLGGPSVETRSALAIGTIARNAGLALYFLVLANLPQAIPCVVGYLIVGAVISLPYTVWVKKQMKQNAALENSEPSTVLADT